GHTSHCPPVNHASILGGRASRPGTPQVTLPAPPRPGTPGTRFARSCTSTLRIIRSIRASGTIPPFHHRARGLGHDSTPSFLPVGSLGTPVAVCYAARCLAQPMHDGTGHASYSSSR